MVDWMQLAGMAGKAFSAIRDWTDTLSQEREIFIPEGMINTAITAMLGKDNEVKSVLVECHDGFADLDILVVHEGTDIQIRATFELVLARDNQDAETIASASGRRRSPARSSRRGRSPSSSSRSTAWSTSTTPSARAAAATR